MSVTASARPGQAERRFQAFPAAVALAGLVSVAVMSAQFGGLRYALATLIGGIAGVALYHASFGFTGAWRRIVTERRGNGLRAQMLLLAMTCAISYPLLAYGSDFGLRAGGWVLPFGVVVAAGSFIFGAGMQLGGGCGSGTLFTAGGGSTRMMITLAAFIAGSLIGTAHLPYLRGLPQFEAVSLVRSFGPWLAIAITFAFVGAIYLVSQSIEKNAHGSLEPSRQTGSIVHGPWSLLLGAVVIAFVGIATMLVLGRPWGITSAFALWGAKIASNLGIAVETWPYWKGQAVRIDRSVFSDTTSIMDFGIIFGAMAAAALASKYRPVFSIRGRDIATAIIGGLLMGYGARLAYGCNIGAYLGGIVSGSLHGWFWGFFAFVGSSAMALLKPRIGLG